MNNIRQTVFNPLLSTENEVRAFLATQPDGTAHPFNTRDRRTLLIKTGSSIQVVDISNRKSSDFIDNIDRNQLNSTLEQRINTHAVHLVDIKDYTVCDFPQNGCIIPIPQGGISIMLFALSVERNPDFYDLCVGTRFGNNINWNSQSLPALAGLTHSGDINQSSILLHTVTSGGNLTTEPFVVFLSGYNNQPLYKYMAQRPAVLLVNHVTKTLYVVPVPLDQATIGNATVCCPLVCQRVGDSLKCVVLSAPPTLNGVHATGAILNNGRDTLSQAITIGSQMINALNIMPPAPVVAFVDPPAPQAKSNSNAALGTQSVPVEPNIVAIIENGCTLPLAIKNVTHYVQFGEGVSVNMFQAPTTEPEVRIPALFGTVSGPLILALGKPYTGIAVNNLSDIYNVARNVVVIVSDKMRDQERSLNSVSRINGIFIIVPSKPIPTDATREQALNDLNINAVTALAGPQSIILVQDTTGYIFYRGIRWLRLAKSLKFGDKLTATDVNNWLSLSVNWNRLYSLDNKQVYYNGQRYNIDQIYQMFLSLSISDISSNMDDIADVLTQLQVILSAEEIQSFSTRLMLDLERKIDSIIKPQRDIYIKFMMNPPVVGSPENVISTFKTRKNQLFADLRNATKAANATIKTLINMIGNLVSSRNSSTKQHDLKQLIRKTTIANNVTNAKDMNYEQLAQLLEQYAEDVGCVIGDIGDIAPMLQMVGTGGFLQHLIANSSGPICRPAERNNVLSGLDVGILLPMAAGAHQGPLVPFDGKISITLPQGFEGNALNFSSLPLVCFDEFVNLTDPSNINWISKCNDAHIATIRILMRGAFANAKASRAFGISPSSKDLGFFLARVITDVMLSIMNQFSRVPDAQNYNDVMCKMMRGLFGQLFTLLGSGSNPLCMAFQLVGKNPNIDVPNANEMWVWSRIVKLYPYTCWPMEVLQKNLKLLEVRLVRKRLIENATEPMRKSLVEVAKKTLTDNREIRDKQLAFLRIAVEVIKHISTPDMSHETKKKIVTRLLEYRPDVDKSRGFGIVSGYLDLIIKGDSIGEDQQQYVLQTCADIFAKRSAILKKAKNVILEKTDAANIPSVVKLSEQVIQKHNTLKEEFQTDTVRLQNIDNITQVHDAAIKQESVPKDLRNKLAGDAERIRTPWSVTGNDTDDESSKTLNYVLTGSHTIGDALVPPPAPGQLVIAPPTLANTLAKIPNSQRAIKCIGVGIPEFCSLTGISEADLITMFPNLGDKLSAIIDRLLAGWQDLMKAEASLTEQL
jgi:hypothetical protein